MSAALASFEFVRRSLVGAVRLVDGVTGQPLWSRADIVGPGLSAYGKSRGVFIITKAEVDPAELSVTPEGELFSPRRALLPLPLAPAEGQPDPRAKAAVIRMLPAVGYPVVHNLTALPCRVVRPVDRRPVALALVRLLRISETPPAEAVEVAASITNIAGEALLVAAGVPLMARSATTPTRATSFKLEAIASLEPVVPEADVRPIGRPVVTLLADAEARMRAGRPWPEHRLDPDALLAAAEDPARAKRVERTIQVFGGRRNASITLELDVPV